MASTFQDRLVAELRLAGASTLEQANDVFEEYLPRFNARFSVASEQPEIAYRPLPAELSLSETISLKHTRKVPRDNTVKYQWQVLNLLPGMDRPSYAGLQVEVLERADGQLMFRNHGEKVNSQESPQPLSSLWGATNPSSVGPDLQPIADDPANGHLNRAQRSLLDSLEPADKEEVCAEGMGTKAECGAWKPVRHSRCTARPLWLSRHAGRRNRRPRGRDSRCAPSHVSWGCRGLPPRSMPWRRILPPNATAPRSEPRPRRLPHH